MSAPDRVTFTRDGRRIEAKPGQTVAAALWAHGDRVLSRSTKYHRPRGYSCGIGKCADCHMRVDGRPNVKTCMTSVEEGMVVEGQNAWPSVRHDLFRVNDIVWSRGFDHHRAFVRPRFLYPLFGAVIRRFAGWGRIPDRVPPAPAVEELRPDVLVVGAGPAGMAAAVAAAEAGAKVLLLEEDDRLGGMLARAGGSVPSPDGGGETDGAALVTTWRTAVMANKRIDVRTSTALAAAYRGGAYLARAHDRILAIKATHTVIATGGYPAEALFEGNEKPGVLRSSAAMKLLHREHVSPGRRAVVYGAGADGLTVARDLRLAGVDVVAVLEPREDVPGPRSLYDDVQATDVPILTRSVVQKVGGWSRVRNVQVKTPNGTKRFAADLLVVALGRKTAPEWFQALGARITYSPHRGGAVPEVDERQETTVPGLFAAGDAAGITTLAGAVRTGRLAGAAAAERVVSPPARALEVPA